MWRTIGTLMESNGMYSRISGIYREFGDEYLNIPFRLTSIGGITECVLESDLSEEKEDLICANILSNLNFS